MPDLRINARWLISMANNKVTVEENRSVFVTNGRNSSIEDQSSTRTAKQNIDLPKQVLMPGYVNAHGHRTNKSTKHPNLRSSPKKHQTRIRNHRREVGHGPNTQKNQRRINPLQHPKIKVIQHRTFLINANLEPLH